MVDSDSFRPSRASITFSRRLPMNGYRLRIRHTAHSCERVQRAGFVRRGRRLSPASPFTPPTR